MLARRGLASAGVLFARRFEHRLLGSTVKVTFVNADRNGAVLTADATVGDTLLETAWKAKPDMLEGACDHCVACSTCHVYIAEPWKGKLNPPTDEELDMLDLAFEPTDDSRLACQVLIREPLDGLQVRVPSGVTNNLSKMDF